MSLTLSHDSSHGTALHSGSFLSAALTDDEKGKQLTRVLVADGNRTVRKILRHTFDALGWETMEADDGEQTLHLAGQRPAPQAILLDLNLRKIDGLEVCRRLKTDIQTRLIPVVALTSLQDNEEKMRAVDAGADEGRRQEAADQSEDRDVARVEGDREHPGTHTE